MPRLLVVRRICLLRSIHRINGLDCRRLRSRGGDPQRHVDRVPIGLVASDAACDPQKRKGRILGDDHPGERCPHNSECTVLDSGEIGQERVVELKHVLYRNDAGAAAGAFGSRPTGRG